jgi:hypothetical protein
MMSLLISKGMSTETDQFKRAYQSSTHCNQRRSSNLDRRYWCKRKFRHFLSKLKPARSEWALTFVGASTNIDCYDIRHCKECCESSPNISKKFGAFPLFGL